MKSKNRRTKKKKLSRVTRSTMTKSQHKMTSPTKHHSTLIWRICGTRVPVAVVDPISQTTSSGPPELWLEHWQATTCSSQDLPAKRSPTKNSSTITWPRKISRLLLFAKTKQIVRLNTERRLKQSQVRPFILFCLKLKTFYTNSISHNARWTESRVTLFQ